MASTLVVLGVACRLAGFWGCTCGKEVNNGPCSWLKVSMMHLEQSRSRAPLIYFFVASSFKIWGPPRIQTTFLYATTTNAPAAKAPRAATVFACLIKCFTPGWNIGSPCIGPGASGL